MTYQEQVVGTALYLVLNTPVQNIYDGFICKWTYAYVGTVKIDKVTLSDRRVCMVFDRGSYSTEVGASEIRRRRLINYIPLEGCHFFASTGRGQQVGSANLHPWEDIRRLVPPPWHPTKKAQLGRAAFHISLPFEQVDVDEQQNANRSFVACSDSRIYFMSV